VFGILPFISVEQLVYQFSPLANYLAEKLQVPVRIETAPDFVEFARRTHEESRYDILFTAPHFYTQAHRKAGYRLIVSVDSQEMWAVIVVPDQSDIHSIQDLRGKRLATVSPLGLATLLVRKHLADAGIDPDVDLSLIITPTHDASLLSSYHGVTDASALMLPPFEAASRKVRESMRIVAQTESTPHIPISLGPWIDDACAAEITSVLLEMGSTPEGRAVLEHNSFSGFKQVDPEVYEQLDELLFR
jgi:phosphonate transport system substrate-binding protein